MNRILLFSLFLFFIFTCQGASAQATKRDGVTRKSGKMIEIKNGKEMSLTHTFTATDGTKVSSSGMVTYANGNKEKLPEGYAINKQGDKVNYKDDMIEPDKINEHQKKITGKTETTVTITEKTRMTINDSTGRKAVYDTLRNVEKK